MTTSQHFRSARKHVMRELLLPTGFIETGTRYVRHVGNQIHLIDFQTGNYGEQYMINIGFHYDFLPGFFHHRFIKLEDIDNLDCLFLSRLSSLRRNYPKTIPYGEDLSEVKQRLRCFGMKSLEAIDEWAIKWENPDYFLKLVTPEILAARVKTPPYPDGRPPDRATYPLVRDLLKEWDLYMFHMAYLLITLSIRHSDIGLAKDYAAVDLDDYCDDDQKKELRVLVQGI